MKRPALLAVLALLPLPTAEPEAPCAPAMDPTPPSVEEFIRQVQELALDIKHAERLPRPGGNVAIVFLPGIPGSTLSRERKDIFGVDKVSGIKLILPTDDKDLFSNGQEHNIDTDLLSSYRAYVHDQDQYGQIMRDLDRNAINGEASRVVFSYDWRLDVRTTARLLDICFTGRADEEGPILEERLRRECAAIRDKEILLVAHSFGGLVCWWWQQEFHTTDSRVRHIALLGTPLAGSCEMLNALLKGYVPKNASLAERLMAAALLGKDLQAAGYTFPGVFEVIPPDLATGLPGATSCLDTPAGPAKIFEVGWWKGDAWGGKFLSTWRPWDVLGGIGDNAFYGLLNTAQTTAVEFRHRLELRGVHVPGTYFHSRSEKTPQKGRIRDRGRIQFDVLVDGDGRVTWSSIEDLQLERLQPSWRVMELKEAHGALADSRKFAWWLNGKIKAVDSLAHAAKLAELLIEDAKLLAAYQCKGHRPPALVELVAIFGTAPKDFMELYSKLSLEP